MHLSKLNDTEAVLKKIGMYITEPRKTVLQAFLDLDQVLTLKQIKDFCQFRFDRVTIYRTLTLFLQVKLVYVLPSCDTVLCYGLSQELITGHNETSHLYFICNSCNQTLCFKDDLIPVIQLPKDYLAMGVQVIVKGMCQQCCQNNSSPVRKSSALNGQNFLHTWLKSISRIIFTPILHLR